MTCDLNEESKKCQNCFEELWPQRLKSLDLSSFKENAAKHMFFNLIRSQKQISWTQCNIFTKAAHSKSPTGIQDKCCHAALLQVEVWSWFMTIRPDIYLRGVPTTWCGSGMSSLHARACAGSCSTASSPPDCQSCVGARLVPPGSYGLCVMCLMNRCWQSICCCCCFL